LKYERLEKIKGLLFVLVGKCYKLVRGRKREIKLRVMEKKLGEKNRNV
jgi:hypothetical protein